MGEIKLPSHWKEVCFGEVCSLRKEPVQPTDDPDIAYVGLEHIDPGHPNLTRTGTASEVKSSKSKFYFGDILYGKLRPYLDKAVLADFEGICSTDILVFKVNGLIKPEFLTYLVHTKAFINHAIRTTRGVNHPRTSWASLVQFYFSLPPLHEQKTIAHTLQTIQKAKETCQRELELERERKAALMQYLFTHGTHNEPRKDKEIGGIPKSWIVSRFDSLCVLQRGFDITKKEQNPGKFPVISSGGISSYHNFAKVKGPGVIIGRKGTLGSVHYVDCDYWPHDTTLWVKQFNENNPLFIAYFLYFLNLKRFDSGAKLFHI